jgi:hypothetical protein
MSAHWSAQGEQWHQWIDEQILLAFFHIYSTERKNNGTVRGNQPPAISDTYPTEFE